MHFSGHGTTTNRVTRQADETDAGALVHSLVREVAPAFASLGADGQDTLALAAAATMRARGGRPVARAGLSPGDIDVFEFAEAFAALCLRFRRDLDAGPDRMNPNGGTMAMGHAFGATGAILVGQCVEELERRGGRWGVAAVSGAAGLGTAVLVERVDG